MDNKKKDEIRNSFNAMKLAGFSEARPRTDLKEGCHTAKVIDAEVGTSTKNDRKRVFIRYKLEVEGQPANVLGGVEYLDKDTLSIKVEKPAPRPPVGAIEERYAKDGMYQPFDTITINEKVAKEQKTLTEAIN